MIALIAWSCSVHPDNLEANLTIVDVIESIARDKGATASQIALAWVIGQGDDIAPIPGTKRRAYLEQNVGALEIEFSERDLARLGDLAATAGDRYADMALIDRSS